MDSTYRQRCHKGYQVAQDVRAEMEGSAAAAAKETITFPYFLALSDQFRVAVREKGSNAGRLSGALHLNELYWLHIASRWW